MPANSLLQDVGSLIGTNIDLNQDIKEITEKLREMLQEKYFNKITALVQDHRAQVKQNPTRETALLQAVKPYIDSKVHSQIDMLIEAMDTMRTFQNLQEQVKRVQNQDNKKGGENLLVQDDGVYEIDEACMLTKNQNHIIGNEGLILFFLLLFFLL